MSTAGIQRALATSNFRDTIDTTRETVCLYVAPAGNDTIPIKNRDGDTVDHPVGGEYLDICINEAPTTAYTVIYYYSD